ncbi:MAG TPA: hypothetical protein DCL21_03755 [Alphaproteobacteria bacterium]|nr:hypothetical protein [Alphaproteobacteria bacterium]
MKYNVMLTKKGAMFGLEGRVLRKYAGSIFLASLRRLTFRLVVGHQASQKLTAQGAMFGLDARIALAIFGALSVISGAALHSAIQHARVVSLVTEMQEVGKAVESYLIDVGDDLVKPTPSTYKYDDLVVEPTGIKNWEGPYYPLKEGINVGGWEVDHPIYGKLLIRSLNSNLGAANYSNGCSVAPCYYWIQVNGVKEDLVKEIDLFVDGSVAIDSGKVRIIDIDKSSVFFKGPLTLNQP